MGLGAEIRFRKMVDWDKRRENMRAIIAYKGLTGTEVARRARVSLNTVTKFMRGESASLSAEALARICQVLEIHSELVLDLDEPLRSSKIELYRMINEMSEEDARAVLEAWHHELDAQAQSGR